MSSHSQTSRFRNFARLAAWGLLASAGMVLLGPGLPRTAALEVLMDEGIAARGQPAREALENVYVKDSAIARDKFAQAERMQGYKEWHKAADLYQELLESKYRFHVVPNDKDAAGTITQYTGVGNRVTAELIRWPQDALDVYRGRNEPKAAELLNKAGNDDLFLLRECLGKYFVTESAKKAGLRLMDAHLERGEYAAAAWLGDDLLRHPNLLVEKAGVLFRTALAYHLAGDPANAERRAQTLAQQFPREMGVVRGKDAVLAEALANEMKVTPVRAAGAASDSSYPMFGGNPSRSLVSPAQGSAGTRMFSIPLAKPEFKSAAPAQRATIDAHFNQSHLSGNTLGVMPVADRGELFFQDGTRVYAVSLNGGVPLPGWAQTHSGTDGQYVLPNATAPGRMSQQTLTLTDRHVLAVMGNVDRQMMMMFGVPIPNQGDARLVCLDRATGRENWAVSLATAPDVPNNEETKAIRALQFSGSPLVVGDSVLTIGRTNRFNPMGGNAQGEDCYVVAFDLSDGKFRWACYIASAGAGANMFGRQALADNTSHLAYANGRVYVLTNLGAAAALDAYSGTIVWLNIYPQDPPDPMMMRRDMMMRGRIASRSSSRLKPWQYNPVIVAEGNVFVLPDEGKHLLVYDAGSGREVKRFTLDKLARWNLKGVEQPDPPNTLVGVAGEKLVLTGNSRVLCLDWKKYDDGKFPENDEAVIWPSGLPKQLRGRPFLTTTALFLPAEDHIRKLDLKSGSAIEEYPRWPRTWDDGEGPGNILVTGDHVVVAGATSVDVYTDLAVATEKLNAELAAAPMDPEPRLRYAEVMFVAGQPDEAIRRLDEAAKLLGGLENLQPGPNRDRLFNDALTFAQKLLADERPGAPERVVKLFDRAAAAAHSPQQQVNYRMSRARYASDDPVKDFAAAVKLYQEVLSGDQMRSVSLADDSGNPVLAEDVAEKAIETIIRSAPGVYEPYQQAAVKALGEAKAEGDAVAKASKLLAIAQQYPNSGVAPEAMLAAADAYESAKQPRQAIRVLRQMWFKYQSSPSRAAIAEGIARNYLSVNDRNRAEMISTAAARLANAAALPGDPKLTRPLRLPDGAVVADAGTSIEKALEEVRKLSGKEAGKTLPDFRLPPPLTQAEKQAGKKYPKPFLPRGEQMIVPDATMLVLPAREFTRADRVITWSPNALSLFKPTKRKPLATSKAFPLAPGAPQAPGIAGAPPGPNPFPGAPRGVAWANDAALVWGGSRLVALDGNTARTLWEIDLSRLNELEVVRSGDVPAGAAPAPALNPNVAIINGQQVIIDARGGRRVIRGGAIAVPALPPAANPADAAPAPGQPAPPVAGQGEQVAEVRPVGDRVLVATTTGRLMSADLDSGRIAWQTRLAEKAADRLVATEDFTVVKTSGDVSHHIFALDTFSGRVIGRRDFSTQVMGPMQTSAVPVNLALSPDGTLVYTLPDRLVLKDLYKGWNEEEKSVAGDARQQIFAGANQPGQLLISEGRILAVADSYGMAGAASPNEKCVRVHSLETGAPLTLKYDANDGTRLQIDRFLTAGTKDWNVILRTVGSSLYVIGPQSVFGYNLDRPAETWKGMTNTLSDGPTSDVNFRDAFIGQSHLVLLDQPPAGANGVQNYRLHAFGRYQKEADANPGESGRLDYSVTISEPPGIAPQWQACDGGFYYATSDGKVRMLVGAMPK